MSSSNQPPKLNYAKGRQKSKNKNQHQSQQKITFQGQSSSDIFSHLNQDNLNYIKKQLKNKKSHHHNQKNKSSHQIKSTQQIKHQSLKSINIQIQQSNKISNQQSIIQQKMYQKYKNQDQVTQKDSRQQQTFRQTENDDSLVSQIQSNKSKPLPKTQYPSQSKQLKQQKFKSNYMGLQPPPLTLNQKRETLQSTDSQNIKQSSVSVQTYKMEKNEKNNTNVKNPFHQYQLRSQTSNNPIGNSTVSVQNHLSQDLSLNFRNSQFIDYLQNYIQQLNSTPQNMSKKYGFSNQQSPQQDRSLEKDFRKKNNLRQYRQKSQDFLNSQRSNKNKLSMQNNTRNIGTITIQSQQKKQLLNESKGRKQSIGTRFKMFQNQQNQNPNNNEFSLEQVQKQLQKQKYYCTKLALQLQKYKQNQQKYRKQIIILNKTIGLLKLQVQNVKQNYEQQFQQTKKILQYLDFQNKHNKRKKSQQSDMYRYQSKESAPQNKIHFQPKHTQKLSAYNQFQQLMKISKAQPLYNNINPRLYHNLNDQFQKGRQAFQQQIFQKNFLSDANFPQQFIKNSKHYEPFGISSKNNYLLKNIDKYKHISNLQDKNQSEIYLQNKRKYSSNNDRNSNHKKHSYHSSPFKHTKFPNNIFQSQQNQIWQRNSRSSLQKLKQEYQNFRSQAKNLKYQNKNVESRNSNKQPSPRKYSYIYVK